MKPSRARFPRLIPPWRLSSWTIVLSDRTFDIVQQTVAAYKGPHSVRLNRNDTNLGIGGNVNRMMELCRGELVVVAAGDDISLPTRTEVTWQAWEQFGRRPTSVCSSYRTISADGTDRGIGGLRGDAGDASPFKLLRGDLFGFLSTRRPVGLRMQPCLDARAVSVILGR